MSRRFQRIQELGCLACRKLGYYSPPDVHHLNLGNHAGGKRLGDEHTIGLCPFHHRGVVGNFKTVKRAETLVGPSLALAPIRFRERFGSDEDLLAFQNELIEQAEAKVVGR